MVDLTVKQYEIGVGTTNCYFAINEKTKEMFIVDPGEQPRLLAEEIEKLGVTPVAILLTHGHFDHAGAAEFLKKRYQIPVYAHEAEKETLANPDLNLSGPKLGDPKVYQADHFVKDGDELTFAGVQIRVLFMPGHTAGGVAYYLPQEKAVFSGDTLFRESIGRTDVQGADKDTMIRSIHKNLLSMPDSTQVYPGHEELTTIGHERENNPFL